MIHLPCRWINRRRDDGDTVSVTMISNFLWRVRLRDIDCPERNTQEGIAAKHFTESVLEEAASELSAEFLVPHKIRSMVWRCEPINLLDWPSFNRVVGDIWVGESNRLSELLVAAGHAKRT